MAEFKQSPIEAVDVNEYFKILKQDHIDSMQKLADEGKFSMPWLDKFLNNLTDKEKDAACAILLSIALDKKKEGKKE